MYKVLVDDNIGKKVVKIPQADQKKIVKVLKLLQQTPLPSGKDLKKLESASFPTWRIRIGNIRIVYSYSPVRKIVKIVDIDYRGNVY